MVYQIFLPMVLRWRASRAGAPLRYSQKLKMKENGKLVASLLCLHKQIGISEKETPNFLRLE